MNVRDIFNLSDKYHKNQTRKDGRTPYIVHPLQVCEMLQIFGITNKKYLSDDLSKDEYEYYAIALMHDLLEDTKISEQEIFDISNLYIYNGVKLLTCKKNDNPFYKYEYLEEIVNSNNFKVFVIKCIDRISNVCDFIKDGNNKYAKTYFHNADILWNKLYKMKEKDKSLFEIYKKVIELNDYFKNGYKQISEVNNEMCDLLYRS